MIQIFQSLNACAMNLTPSASLGNGADALPVRGRRQTVRVEREALRDVLTLGRGEERRGVGVVVEQEERGSGDDDREDALEDDCGVSWIASGTTHRSSASPAAPPSRP